MFLISFLVLLLMVFSTKVKCQLGNIQLMPRQANQPIFDMYKSSLEQNQVPTNGMPFIIKDVNYKPYRSAESASCADKKSGQISIQKSNPSANQDSNTCNKPGGHDAGKSVAAQAPAPPTNRSPPVPAPAPSVSSGGSNQNSQKLRELQKLVQQLYVAQAQVQLEATEIQRAQTIAAAAQQALEEAGNNVRVITAALHAAQETVAGAALRAQTAQLQLAAHDQLLFTARQRVDALSAQMVGLQAEEGIGENKIVVDIPALLAKLKEPLPENQKPTPVPSIIGGGGGGGSAPGVGAGLRPVPDPSNERSADANKFFDQLKIWNEQNAHKNAESVNEKKENLYGDILSDGSNVDSPKFDDSLLEDNVENALNDEIQKPAVADAPSKSNSKTDTLTEDDIKTLVNFIVTTGHKRSPQGHAKSLSDDNNEDSGPKAENEKYFDDFLNSIRNAEIEKPESRNSPQIAKESASKPAVFDSKLSDRILSLHGSLLHPLLTKQIAQPGDQDASKVDLSDDNDMDLDYKMPDASNENCHLPFK